MYICGVNSKFDCHGKRHCERSEAIYCKSCFLDCFVVSPRNDSKQIIMKQITDFKLIEKQDFGRSVLLRLRSSQPLPDIQPGQFVQVRVDDSPSTYLRRPISIHDVDFQQNEITLLVQQVGEGTRHLAQAESGTYINMVLPLGNGFTIPENGEKCLLVGGGIGIAPLFYFAKVLKEKGIVSKGGLFKPSRLSNHGLDKTQFEQLDKRRLDIIPLNTKKATVMSNHPESSYELANNEDGGLVLNILDKDTFWSVSNYLVVSIK